MDEPEECAFSRYCREHGASRVIKSVLVANNGVRDATTARAARARRAARQNVCSHCCSAPLSPSLSPPARNALPAC